MDAIVRRVFAACMSTLSKRRLSNLTFFSGATFLVSGLCIPIATGLAAEVVLTIWTWNVPVLLIALVVDVCCKRYWALALLVPLVAALVLLVLAIRAVTQGVCCG